MKRSDALELIEDSLREIDMNANTKLFAEEILKKLEKSGMKPFRMEDSGCLHSMRECCSCQPTIITEWDWE